MGFVEELEAAVARGQSAQRAVDDLLVGGKPTADAKLIGLHADLSRLLDQVLALFKPGAKATLVVIQPPDRGDAGVVIGNACLDKTIEEIRRRQADTDAKVNPKRSKPRRMKRSR